MLKLEIVTPEKRVLDAEVDSVTVPTASGEAGILPHHAPLVSALKPGVLAYSVKGSTDRIAVAGR
jgi:F-type H+-transporting ATPase subunit epsilon